MPDATVFSEKPHTVSMFCQLCGGNIVKNMPRASLAELQSYYVTHKCKVGESGKGSPVR